MTSKSSSWTEKSNSQLATALRRKWVIGLCALCSFLYFPIGLVVVLVGARGRYISVAEYPFLRLDAVMVNAAASWIGTTSFYCMLTIGLAMVLAIEGYRYLYKKEMIDFYEATPEKRSKRFWRIFLNGILIHSVTLIAGMILSLIVAGGFGIFRKALYLETAYNFIELTILFIGIYSLCILGAIVSGNVIIAILSGLFLISVEFVFRVVWTMCKSQYFATYYSRSLFGSFFTSPVYNYLCGRTGMADNKVYRISRLIEHIGDSWKYNINTIIIAVIAIAIAYFAYKKRKNEFAGQSFVFRIAQWIVKISVAVIGGIFTGACLDLITNGAVAVMFMGVVIAVLVLCLVLEIVFNQDFKALFKNFWIMPVCAVAAIAVILGFRFDVTGYELYTPDPSKVESCAIYEEYSDYTYYDRDLDIITSEDYFCDNMRLGNVEAVRKVGFTGQERRSQYFRKYVGLNPAKPDTYDESYYQGYEKILLYRMKNGKEVYRRISIPYTINETLMDEITSDQAYRDVLFQKDEVLMDKIVSDADNYRLSYSTGMDQLEGDGSLIKGFYDVYYKDLETYKYSLAVKSKPTGYVNISPFIYDYGKNRNYNQSFIVFPEYTDTVKYLKDNGVYLDTPIRKEYIDQIYITHDMENKGTEGEESTYETMDHTYTDSKQIDEIMNNIAFNGLNYEWFRNEKLDYKYTVTIFLDHSKKSYYGAGPYYTDFWKDSVPAFVIQDLS
ncbi:MAG: hypothetical protein K6F99_09625 [Lachnospiraceae bacterium]|nr:hypothetical protein [Lachnospiraceae bacterium]